MRLETEIKTTLLLLNDSTRCSRLFIFILLYKCLLCLFRRNKDNFYDRCEDY